MGSAQATLAHKHFTGIQASATGEFRKIRDTLFWGPYNKDPTI